MALPSNMGTCLVIGTFIRAVVDSADPDRDPDSVPIAGMTATFTASVSLVRNVSTVPPVTVILDPIVCTTDAAGALVGADGAPGIRLVASDDADLDPTGWTYRVRLSAPSIPTLEFSFAAPVGGTVDLSTVVPVPASPGAELVAWQEAVAATLAARDDVLDAIPAGGTTGQVLAKASDADLDTVWVTGTGGGGGGDTPDATTTVKGKVKLAGDLGGTADAPTVPGLAGKANTSHTHTIANVTGLQTALDGKQPAGSYAAASHSHAQSDVTGLTAALSGKANTSHSHVEADVTGLTAALAAKAPTASPTFTGTVSGVTKSHVGLGNVDNTADTAKPVSTAQQTALNLKANLASPSFTGNPTAPTPTAGDNGPSVATTAFVTTAVAAGGGGGGAGIVVPHASLFRSDKQITLTGEGGGNHAPLSGQIGLLPIPGAVMPSLKAVLVNVTTAASAETLVEVAAYTLDTLALIVSFGTFDMATTGAKTLTAAATLPTGGFVLAAKLRSASVNGGAYRPAITPAFAQPIRWTGNPWDPPTLSPERPWGCVDAGTGAMPASLVGKVFQETFSVPFMTGVTV